MSSMFKTPKMPGLQDSPKPQQITDDSREAEEERRRRAARRGAASTVLTSDYKGAAHSSPSKTLLGE